MVSDTFCHRGRVSLPKAAPELRLFRAPFPEARGGRKKGRKKEGKKESKKGKEKKATEREKAKMKERKG